MATLRNRKFMLAGAALTTVLMVVAAGIAGNNQQNQQQSYDQSSQQGFGSANQMGSQDQQDQQQFSTQTQGNQAGGQMGAQDEGQQYATQTPPQQGNQAGGQMGQLGSQAQQDAQAGMQGSRNQPLERQVATQLRNQGLGQQGQLLVLAVGNRVILLGEVPNQNDKQQAEQITHQVSGVGQVDNRVVVLSQAGRRNDRQLQQDIQQQLSRLPTGAGQNIQVAARNGRIILRGQVNNWQDMADAIQAAFTAGAPYVVSQITTTSGQSATSQMNQSQNQARANQQDQSGYAAGQQNRTRYVSNWQGRGQSASGQSSGYNTGDQWSSQSSSSSDQYGQYGYQPPEGGYGGTYDQSQPYGRSTSRDRWRQTGEDRRMEQRLTTELRNNVQGVQDITILVAGNKAFIFGRAQSQDAKNQATSLVRNISGLQRVENDLIVSPQGWQRQDDAAIRSSIANELQASPHVAAEKIRVSVRNGVATLSGRVDSFGEEIAAIQSAYQAGARSVRNRLTVSGRSTAGESSGYYPSYGYESDQSMGGGYGTQGGTSPSYGSSGQSTGGYGTQGGYSPYGGTSDQSTSGGFGNQGTSSQPYGGTSDQSMGGGATTEGVVYQLNTNTSNPPMGNNQGYYPSYGYTPSESDEDQSQEFEESSATQGGQQSMSTTQPTPSPQQPMSMGRQRMNTADMILAQRVALELQRQLSATQTIHALDPHAIYVAVNQGTITLQGQVQEGSLKQQAEQIARSIRGVQTVQNQLLVAGQGGAFPPLGYVPGQQGSSSMSTQRSTGQPMTSTDRNLSQQIDQQIRQQLPGASITVTVSQGAATLQGSVQDNSQKQQAEQIAKSISGIQNVQNNLTVSGQTSTFGQSATTGQRPSSRQPSTMGQPGQSQPGAPPISSDKILARQVALELQQQLPSNEVVYVMDPQSINVLVTQGTIMLLGSVSDQSTKQQAEQIARSVSGARNIQNALIVGSSQQRAMGQMGMTSSDRQLAQQIQQQLQQQLPNSNINVTISQGTAMLQGTVSDQNQKQQAEQIAKSVSGVMSVQNNLTVGSASGTFPPLGYTPGQGSTSGQNTGMSGGMSSSDQSQTY